MMSLWEKTKGDLQEGIAEGIEILKDGTDYVKKKAQRLTEKGKSRLELLELKIEVRKEMAELGGRVYDLKDRVGSPLSDPEVGAIVDRIRSLEDRIRKLEGTSEKSAEKISVEAQRSEGGEDEKGR